MVFDELSHKVIGCCIEVHKFPGPGLLENAYKSCLASELQEIGLKYKMEYELPVIYKDKFIECGYRIDLLIEDCLIVELKSVEKLLAIHG
ncbi:MAG: hypothetical protein A2015_03990 [Spirochaetes bacterium GWF1_31_7]|nr:MAG: hypothetical protein A2Y30_14765 [Spirochaetes bacterium GWE1_32_154]OHD48654.1 MAG: hypothetical protein A2015_03990 [Spirochaetes bacterium GWF1_31_7]OHD50216.1 MAG: hypothetical protein A2Y29_12815 [Spirochaetes bacterium GWE2_31_10]OHD82421.1 MAG: hypothetical protein A2355_01165 [Spirochaetes bacterium RIFOXYB1_FULL_32_8]HBD94002.1 GxxExxY protein [Spirochaetia bacterium]